MTALQIITTGMCCAVGYNTEAACAAMRAGMDHFRETLFTDYQGNLIIGAELYGIQHWGVSRMAWMFQQVLLECMDKNQHLIPKETCLILITPELDRPDNYAEWSQDIFQMCTQQHGFHGSSCALSLGKIGIIPALAYANQQLLNSDINQVLIVGVDSFFTSSTISHYLNTQRLLTTDNEDGFIPGEAAGAIVVTLPNRQKSGLIINGMGQAEEPAHILQDNYPNRANGLFQAICAANADCGSPLTNTLFHMSAIGNESFYFKEIELAISRSLEHKVADYPHIMLSSSLGEVGAASGPLILAYLSSVMRRSDGPGHKGLIHFSDDSGRRAAARVEWQAISHLEI